jgi:hypothetical protein
MLRTLPIDVTDTTSPSMLAATNVPENDETEWDSTTTYADGDVVMVTDAGVHKRYESLQGSNTDNYPPDNLTGSPAYWLELGSTNRWAMFDDTVGAATVSSETFSESTYAVDTVEGTAAGIAVQIAPQQPVNYIAAFNLSGAYVDLIVDDADGNTLYSQRRSLTSELSEADWYAYFFEPYVQINDTVAFNDVPTISAGDIYFSVQKTSGGDAECGVLAMGVQKDLGIAVYGTRIGITDFSKKERDTFGNFQIIERGFAKEMTAQVSVPFNRVSQVQRTLAEGRAKPAVYEASDAVGATIVYGFFTDFEITISTPSLCDATIDIEGLV